MTLILSREHMLRLNSRIPSIITRIPDIPCRHNHLFLARSDLFLTRILQHRLSPQVLHWGKRSVDLRNFRFGSLMRRALFAVSRFVEAGRWIVVQFFWDDFLHHGFGLEHGSSDLDRHGLNFFGWRVFEVS